MQNAVSSKFIFHKFTCKEYSEIKAVISLILKLTLREKCPNTEFFLVRIFPHSDWIRENMDQKKLRIWTLFTQCNIKNTESWSWHCVKSVHIPRFYGPYFPAFGLNTDHKNYEYEHFLHAVWKTVIISSLQEILRLKSEHKWALLLNIWLTSKHFFKNKNVYFL